MKFVTEMDLRDSYGREPYAAYVIEKNTRLTPGARQFLVDRNINIIDQCATPIKATNNSSSTGVKAAIASPQGASAVAAKTAATTEAAGKGPSVKKDWRLAKLRSKLVTIEGEFLRTEEELLGTDVMLAQKVVELGKQFRTIRSTVEGKGEPGTLAYHSCSGMDAARFMEDLGDCFEITEFHAQLPNGKVIVSLFVLRAALREIEPVTLEYCEANNGSEERCNIIIGKVNEIINVITQLIHGAVGGKECLRKM